MTLLTESAGHEEGDEPHYAAEVEFTYSCPARLMVVQGLKLVIFDVHHILCLLVHAKALGELIVEYRFKHFHFLIPKFGIPVLPVIHCVRVHAFRFKAKVSSFGCQWLRFSGFFRCSRLRFV